MLGVLTGINDNRWKMDAAEAGEGLGWDVTHVDARGIPADDVVRMAKGADALIWLRTHGHHPTGDIAGMLRRVEDAGTATIGVHLDLYWGVPRREAQIGVHPWWTCQHVWTADGGDRDWASKGVNHHWCPPPLGHRFLGRGAPDARHLCTAVFVGSHVPGIHGPHRRALLDWAMRRWGGQFHHLGWDRRNKVWGHRLNDVYASARVVLGDSAPAPRYWSDRVPCTLGRGGLLAHPRTEGMAEQGFDDETMILFDRGAFDKLGARIANLTDAERHTLTGNAIDLVASRHMWTHRLRDIEQVVAG